MEFSKDKDMAEFSKEDDDRRQRIQNANDIVAMCPFSSPTRIVENLYLGSLLDVHPETIKRRNIKYVVNLCFNANDQSSVSPHGLSIQKRMDLAIDSVTHQCKVVREFVNPLVEDGIHYLCIPAADSLNFPLFIFFDFISAFINDARLTNSNVLVHCYAGISRSASIVIAYLISYLSMSLIDALTLVKQARPIICPNENFIEQLVDYEEDCSMFNRN